MTTMRTTTGYLLSLTCLTLLLACGGVFAARAQDGTAEKGIVQQAAPSVQANVAVNGSIWAVIVGIDYETNKDISPLNYAESDAAKFKQTLIDASRGLISDTRTRVLTGAGSDTATRLELIRAVKAAADNAGPQDTILIYFSGHGVTDGGVSYLVPVDGVPDLPADSAVSVDRIYELLSQSAAARTVIFLDACHSGSVSVGRKEATGRNAMPAEFAQQLLSEARGRVVFSSCDIDQVSLETPETGGVFTNYLCEGLKGPANTNGDGYITVSELANYVTQKVREWSFANNAAMTPILANAVSGDIPLVVVPESGQKYAFAEPQRVDPQSLLISRELSFEELQGALGVQENLAQAKVILYGSREEASLNAEFRSDLKIEQVEQAIGQLRSYLAAYPESPEGHRYMSLAQWLRVGMTVAKPESAEYYAGIDANVLPELARAVELEPHNPANFLYQAQVLLDRGHWDQAIAAAQQALALNPDLIYGYINWGQALNLQGKYGEALRVLQTAAQKFPDNPHVWKNMADAYLNRGQPTAALGPLQTAERLYTEVGTGYYATLAFFLQNLGYAYYWTDRDKANQAFAQAIDTIKAHEADEADNPYYWKFFGSLSYSLNRMADYRAGVLLSSEMDPGDAYVLTDRGVYYRVIGNETLAESDIRQALALEQETSYIWVELASTLMAKDDYAAALPAWDKAVALAPEALGTLISRGGCKLLTGDAVGAEQDFRQALAAAPEDCDLLNSIALAYDAAGDNDTAIVYYKRAAASRESPLYHYNLALSYHKSGDLDQAQAELDKALSGNPGYADYINLAGDLAAARGEQQAALKFYRDAAAHKRSHYHLIDLAQYLTQLGDPGAQAAWDSLVHDFADLSDAWMERAWHFYQQERYQDAISDYQQALALVPENEEAENRWGICLGALGDAAGAEQHYRLALELNPNPTIYTNLIDLLDDDPARAADVDRCWQELLAAFPNHPDTLLANGDRLYDAGSYAAAAEVYARGVQVDPTNPSFPNRQANCLYSLAQYDESIALYQRSLDLAFDAVVVSNLAGAYIDAGQQEEADKVWRTYQELHPQNPQLLMQYGLSLYNAGDNEAALEQYLRGQKLDPRNDLFYNRAGLCLFNLGRYAEAVKQVEQALALKPDPLYYANLGLGYDELGDAARAEQYYKEGLAKYPQDAGLLKGYGEFLDSQGRGAEALGQLQSAARLSSDPALYAQAAQLAAAQGNSPLAVELYSAALKLNPADATHFVEYALFLAGDKREAELSALLKQAASSLDAENLGWLEDELGAYFIDQQEFETGARYMEQLIALAPQVPVGYNGLAMFHYLQGDAQAALAAVKRGLNDAGESYFGRYLEAFFTFDASGAAAALPLAQALLELEAPGADAYTLLLQLQIDTRDYAGAIATGTEGLAVYPQNADLLYYTAQAYTDCGDSAGAVSLLSDPAYSAVELYERDALLGRAYLELRNYAKAAAHLTAATNAYPEDAGLWADLARSLYLTGDASGTREAATRALALDPALLEPQLWLAFALLDQGESAGSESALDTLAATANLPAPLAGWLALGEARLAQAGGDTAGAQAQLAEAQAAAAANPDLAAAITAFRQSAGI